MGQVKGSGRRVGVISDTHGLLREMVKEAFRGVDLIIHAGDIGKEEILTALAKIAPVVAVRGNMDRAEWALKIPETKVVTIDETQVYLVHDAAKLDVEPNSVGFGAVINGHTHRPAVIKRRGVLFLNPGSAGPRRFNLPVTVAILRVHGKALEADVVEV
ncbi:MAG TPA: metallophosphoesterase family protein [Syntrophobacteria bacterium]|nr:metallophosphoesterase family protein [Syntrophobacteria bacterium]